MIARSRVTDIPATSRGERPNRVRDRYVKLEKSVFIKLFPIDVRLINSCILSTHYRHTGAYLVFTMFGAHA